MRLNAVAEVLAANLFRQPTALELAAVAAAAGAPAGAASSS